MASKLQQKLSKKIKKLTEEGYPQKQAVAIAYNMIKPKRRKKHGPRS